jgi:hypothetical protein
MTFRLRLSLVSALLLAACAGPLAQITADRDDYWAYRQVKSLPSIDARLQAAQRYLRERPRGRFHGEVARWFDAREPAFFRAVGSDLAGMRRYLEALPDGPHREIAAERVAQIERTRELASSRDAAEIAGAHAVQARMASAAAGRDALIRTFADWTRDCSSITTWGGRTSELDHEFIYRFRLLAPEAHCDSWRCVKGLASDYAVPEGTTLVAREAVFDIVLRLDRGGVAAAEIAGPELFTRVGEALLMRPIAPDDITGRIEALGRVADLVGVSIETALPASRCQRAPTSPVVVERECDGLHVRMIAATEPDQDDRIIIEPVVVRLPPQDPVKQD